MNLWALLDLWANSSRKLSTLFLWVGEFASDTYVRSLLQALRKCFLSYADLVTQWKDLRRIQSESKGSCFPGNERRNLLKFYVNEVALFEQQECLCTRTHVYPCVLMYTYVHPLTHTLCHTHSHTHLLHWAYSFALSVIIAWDSGVRFNRSMKPPLLTLWK